MPASLHPVFSHPGHGVKIWRYMDFTKYVSMLEKGALYFCRADLLGDPYEGSLPEKNIVGEREFFVSEVMKEHSIDTIFTGYSMRWIPSSTLGS